MNVFHGFRWKGFTLIELLIVVAIIAILAAIAVPNFLEAQVRSKVSRCLSDQRSLATAIEAYRVDNNQYPRCESVINDPAGLCRLSTPVSYITNPLMSDPFLAQGKGGSNWPAGGSTQIEAKNYAFKEFWSPEGSAPDTIVKYGPRFESTSAFPIVKGQNMHGAGKFPGPIGWFLVGYGPDGAMQLDNDLQLVNQSGSADFVTYDVYMPYDSTNGTKSMGDIVRFGP